MVNLLDFDAAALTDWFLQQGEKPFRAKQVLRWVHRFGVTDFEQMTDVAKSLRAKLAATACITPPVPVRDSISTDGTRKWLLDVGNANAVETVIRSSPRCAPPTPSRKARASRSRSTRCPRSRASSGSTSSA